jgi:predicted helicase
MLIIFFDIKGIEVIKAESQVVLNTITEHDFQDAFKRMAEALGKMYTGGRGLIRGCML